MAEFYSDIARTAKGAVAVGLIVSLVEEIFYADKDFQMLGGPPIGMDSGHSVV